MSSQEKQATNLVNKPTKPPSLLLHTCCGPCATHCVELLKEKYQIQLFFSNSNINTKEEFDLRLTNAQKLAEKHQIPLLIDDYNHQAWLKFIAGFEKEPEGKKRCQLCFRFNITKTALMAYRYGFQFFTTTLTVSRFKNSQMIFEEGKIFKPFLNEDFKKNNGFNKSLELSREIKLYRQKYCGCEFSIPTQQKQ